MSRNIIDDPFYTSARCVLIAKTCIDCGRFLSIDHFWRNGKDGRRPECGSCANYRLERMNTAWAIPRSGILLAKTCTDCGNFHSAKAFWRNGKPGRFPACGRCMKGRKYRYSQRKAAA